MSSSPQPDSARRWADVLGVLRDALAGVGTVAVTGEHAVEFAQRLAAAIGPGTRVTTAADQGEVVVWLRTAGNHHGREADVVVDMQNPQWPVIRHIEAALADPQSWHLRETQAFFAPKAATWDARFGDDRPAYARAIAAIGIAEGSVVVDVGCGTGRALPALRTATGAAGLVIGLDATLAMLEAAAGRGRALLVAADARCLPLRDASVDVLFAAGLVTHLPDLHAGLVELARVCRVGGRLALFHPTGRAALAARHGRALSDDELLDESRLDASLAVCGWVLDVYDDAPDRFLALAIRTL
jgi:SAM-dependent methyltransferase